MTNLVQSVTYPNGGWSYYTYESQGRKTNEYSAYGNCAFPTNGVPNVSTNQCKLTQYFYSLDSTDDGISASDPYDSYNSLSLLKTTVTPVAGQQFAYAFDAIGNRTHT